MNKSYSVWARRNENIGHTLVAGLEPPRFRNGEIDEECEVCLYSFEAASHEEAMAIYYTRQGWAPYKPEGEAAPCPKCGAMYYPEGSGECWSCDYSRYE